MAPFTYIMNAFYKNESDAFAWRKFNYANLFTEKNDEFEFSSKTAQIIINRLFRPTSYFCIFRRWKREKCKKNYI